jgi:N-acetylneuraminate synthase
LHIVDAEGVDGEGLQIGEGMVDFAMTAEVLDRCAPEASFIPEIWQGHKNDGAGFWTALDRLERWF